MAEIPPSPPAPRARPAGWLDPRLLLGVLLVLASIVAGSRVLASADQSQQVWVVTRDLAPGAALGDADLTAGRVRLFDAAGRYVSALAAKPTGYVAVRGLGAGELLPVAAVARPGTEPPYRGVTVPVTRGHLPPDLRAGQQVDVYLTPDEHAHPSAPPRLVLAYLTVLDRPSEADLAGGGASEVPVLLQVRPEDVITLMAALAQGHVDLVRVPRSQERDLAAAGRG